MDIEYRIHFSEEHLLTSVKRYGQLIWWRRPFFRGFTLLLAALLLALSVIYQVRLAAVFFGAALVTLPLTRPLDAWLLRRRFRHSPYHNDDVVFQLSEIGAHAVGRNNEVRLSWGAFTKARRFKDGLLLFQGSHMFNWLPDSAALDVDAIKHAQELVRARIADYRDV
jgi:YcxB-like protein